MKSAVLMDKVINKEVLNIIDDGTHKISSGADLDINVKDDVKAILLLDSFSENISVTLGNNSDVKIINYACQADQDVVLQAYAKCVVINILSRDSSQRYSLHEYSDLKLSNMTYMKSQEIKVNTSIDHLSRNANSLMLSKGVLEKSRLTIRGAVNIMAAAFGSNGFQKTEMLILDKESKAISIPELNIKNHDVKCTHGAAISSLDEEKMFYMQSRGIDYDDSKALVIQGFFNSLLADIPKDITDDIMERLRRD